MIPEITDNFLKKMTTLYEENYTKIYSQNIIFSISSMLILSSYYLIYYIKDEEKYKRFKSWHSGLSQKQAIIYFEQIYNLIIGGIYDINDLLSSAKDFLSNSENNLNSKNFLIKKKVK